MAAKYYSRVGSGTNINRLPASLIDYDNPTESGIELRVAIWVALHLDYSQCTRQAQIKSTVNPLQDVY